MAEVTLPLRSPLRLEPCTEARFPGLSAVLRSLFEPGIPSGPEGSNQNLRVALDPAQLPRVAIASLERSGPRGVHCYVPRQPFDPYGQPAASKRVFEEECRAREVCPQVPDRLPPPWSIPNASGEMRAQRLRLRGWPRLMMEGRLGPQSEVRAASGGVVVDISLVGAMGPCLRIYCGRGLSLRYCFRGSLAGPLRLGDSVSAGQVLGRIAQGATPPASPDHSAGDFSLTADRFGKPLDPFALFKLERADPAP